MKLLGPGIIAAGVVILGVSLCAFLIVLPNVVDNKVKEETRLVENSDTWNKWKDVSVPVQLKFYVFNIVNPDAAEKNEKYILEERGPYVYEEKRQKTILKINEAKDTVTYRETITYFFNRSLSAGPDTDTFNTINFPFVTLSTVLRETLGVGLGVGLWIANKIINDFVKAGESFVVQNVSVKDFFFEGYPINKNYEEIIALTGEVPPEFEGGKFGIYRGVAPSIRAAFTALLKNGSDDGVYEIYSGINDHTKFGEILEWEGGEETGWWRDPNLLPHEEQYCDMINGSDGTVFPPFVDKDRVLRAFVTDICRSIFLTYQEEIEYKGINAYRFTIPKEMLANPKENPDNQCFCTKPGNGLTDYCTGGLIRLFACQNDAPVFTSQPHFMNADEEIQQGVVGLSPDPEKHQTALDLEPRSGQLLQAAKRIQIGIELQRLSGIPAFQDIPIVNATQPSVAVPIFWAEEYAGLSDEDATDLKDTLIRPLNLMKIISIIIYAVSGVIIIAGFVVARRQMKKSDE